MALVNKGAAILVKDVEARERLQAETLRLICDDKQMLSLSQNMKPLARPNAAEDIVKEVMKIGR
jgi:UDP-N-acetylglucosamine--N-acetylmuramyl-(pentapeptide) pyrophosphoryl-undecaprenol N-acetylglucosamine transferase